MSEILPFFFRNDNLAFTSEMPQFFIKWKLSTATLMNSDVPGEKVSEKKLSAEWTLVCLWIIRPNHFKPYSIQFKRIFTEEEISISGIVFLIDGFGRSQEIQFSKCMESGSSSVFFNLNGPVPLYLAPFYYLRGLVSIISNSDNVAANLKCEECSKCAHIKKLSNDFERLLNSETYSFADVKLNFANESIIAHRNILSVRSPVFAAMFQNPMKENHNNEVDINDMDASVARIMLAYIYTGKATILTVSQASELLYNADKYQLQDLKSVCCDFLKENMSPENVLSNLVLGNMHDEDLKSYALDYICNKCPKFTILEDTEEWKILRQDKPALAMDVLISVVKARDEKLKTLVKRDR